MEISIRDVCVKNGLIKITEKIKHGEYYDPKLSEMILKICNIPKYKYLKDRLNNTRHKTNFLIHGNKTVSEKEAKPMLKEALKVIQEL